MKKRIEQMSAAELGELSRELKDSKFQSSVVLAVQKSICDGNSELANRLLKLLPDITRKTGATDALIMYFERRGKLYFDTSSCKLRYDKNSAHTWTSEYEGELMANPWSDLISPRANKSTNKVLDADKEFRKVLERLQRASVDTTKSILHVSLISKVQDVLYAYGRTDEWEHENKRGQTLFDRSTKMNTTRASKFAKGT